MFVRSVVLKSDGNLVVVGNSLESGVAVLQFSDAVEDGFRSSDRHAPHDVPVLQ